MHSWLVCRFLSAFELSFCLIRNRTGMPPRDSRIITFYFGDSSSSFFGLDSEGRHGGHRRPAVQPFHARAARAARRTPRHCRARPGGRRSRDAGPGGGSDSESPIPRRPGRVAAVAPCKPGPTQVLAGTHSAIAGGKSIAT